MIHVRPKAPEGLFLTLFHRDLLFAYLKIAPDITNLVMLSGNHMEEIMNKENDWDHVTAASMVEESIKNVIREEMAIAINVIKPGKAAGPSEVCSR